MRKQQQPDCMTRERFRSLYIKAYKNVKQYVPSPGQVHLTQGEISIDSIEDFIIPVIEMDREKDVLVDLGSGNGAFVSQVALRTNSYCVGVEIEKHVMLYQGWTTFRSMLSSKEKSLIQFINQDLRAVSKTSFDWRKHGTVLFMNNLLFGPGKF